ncbi:MAG: RNA methyltransferase, partial [Cyclobacteriaceae bacterium]
MISKAKIKQIKALQVKKYRKQEQCFVVEGTKSVLELLKADFDVIWLAGTEPFLKQNEKVVRKASEVVEAIGVELAVAGSFQSNDGALAIARMKPNASFSLTGEEFALVLDDIRDPGNLGTIIRTADWYGVSHIIASEETADFYNPKVLSATMGSFCRVQVYYTSLETYLVAARKPIYGTFLEGTDVHELKFNGGGLIVIGNESNGISASIERLISQKITIPRSGQFGDNYPPVS